MEPDKVLLYFNDELLNLPVDDPKFINLLQRHDIIYGETVRKIKLTNQTQADRSQIITNEIENSLSYSNNKFYKFLKLMEEYNHGLEVLAEKMEGKLKRKPGTYVYTYLYIYVCIIKFIAYQCVCLCT